MNNSKKLLGHLNRWTSARVLAISAFCGVGSALAETATLISENDFLADMPIVLSVSRLPQRLDETPGAVTILDREMIRLSGARDVADLLRLVPGFQVSTSFESVAPLVSYHGAFNSYSNRLELQIDGRSVYSPYFIGSIGPGLQTVALADIERIEVLRGSNSAAYGAHAILGVINIVTRHTADTLGAQGALTAGENGVQDAQARIGWGDARATFRLTADSRSDDGLKGAYGGNQVKRVNFRADMQTSARDELQLRLGTLAIDAGKGQVGNISDPLRDSFFGSSYAQLDWRRILDEDQDVLFRLSHTQEVYEDRYPYSLLPFKINDIFIVDASGKAGSDTALAQHTFRYGPALRVVWGGEFRSERVTSRGLYNTDAAFVTDFTRLFGNAEWRASSSVVVNAGAMAEHSSVTGHTFAPRLMVNWHLNDRQTLRAGVSKAFRPPGDYEKFADVRYIYKGIQLGPVNTLASGNVQPESVLSQEIGYLGEFPRWGIGLDVRVFHEQIDGFIRQLNATLPRDYANDENFAIKGLEYQLKWQPWRGAQVIFNQAYTHIGSIRATAGTALAAPELASTLAFFQKFPGGPELTLMHQDNSTATLHGAGRGSQVAMTRTDLRLGWPLRFRTRSGEVAVVVQNLGTPYQDFKKIFEFQRRSFITLNLEY